MGLIAQEVASEPWIDIPGEVLDILRLWRPTPLVRAERLEAALGTPARIYFKDESVSPAGSHKPNTAVPQAFYNQAEGIARLATETGAGQWGTALSFACTQFDLDCKVYMVRVSYEQKPYRTRADGDVGERRRRRRPSTSPTTPARSGSRSATPCATRVGRDDTHYSLGSVLNHVLLHQTVIGLEAKEQLALAGETRPDVVIGCCGGGSNLGGIALPFVADRDVRLVAVEPSSCPTLTEGRFDYDFGDTAGHDAAAADVHARPRLRAAVDPRRRAALPRRLADHLEPRAQRAHGGRRLPAGQDVRGRGAVRQRRGQGARRPRPATRSGP